MLTLKRLDMFVAGNCFQIAFNEKDGRERNASQEVGQTGRTNDVYDETVPQRLVFLSSIHSYLHIRDTFSLSLPSARDNLTVECLHVPPAMNDSIDLK